MQPEDASLFLPADFFMIRTPVLPVDHFFSLFQQKELPNSLSLFQKEDHRLVLEAIAIASSSLYRAIASKKENNQTHSTLLKYFSRMTTRSTPFGIFSFVSMGAWGDSTAVDLDLTKINKRVRPDMEWLFAVIEKLSADPQIFSLFSLRRNPLLFETTGRACLNYYRKKNVEEQTKTVSIRSSILTQTIFALAEKPIGFMELLKKVMEYHPTLERDRVRDVIAQLLQQQYLSLELQPSLLTESPFQDLLQKLEKLPYAIEPLHEVASKIAIYNHTALGEGEEALLTLQQTMNRFVETSNVIQVDAASSQEGLKLSKAVASELSESAELLWRITNDSSAPLLGSYHEKFLEKFGIYRMVPLLDLLHEEVGLGTPDHYLKNDNTRTPQEHTTWRKWLRLKWIDCLREKKTVIDLSADQLDKLLKKADKNRALPSFDLYCEIIANSQKQIDMGEFLLSITNSSWQGGSTFGRFLDLLGQPTKDSLKAFFVEEEDLEIASCFVQSSYLSYIPRNANVAIHPNLRRYGIDINGGSENISLEEIYVGTTSDRFYLTLKDSRQELIITAGNMLNDVLAPIPMRFIRDVTLSRYHLISAFSWMQLEDAPFYPRVQYKKTVLSEAKWKVDLLQLGLKEKDSLEVIQTKFQEWAEKWEVPTYIFIGDGDQRILLDREHPAHFQELAVQIKKGRSVFLTEKIGQSEGDWVQSQQGTHLSEFVIPFIKNSKYSYPTNNIWFPSSQAIQNADRYKLPGSEWLYAKCYLGLEQENRFLTEYFYPFANRLKEMNLISGYFFVRYGDEKSHLRLRFKGDKELITSQLLPLFHDWTHNLLQGRCINEMIIAPYEREIERYGGQVLIESAESLFCADSKTALSLVSSSLSKKITLSDDVTAALSLIDLLNGLGLDIKQQLAFFSSLALEKTELTGFRQQKDLLLFFGTTILSSTLQNDFKEGAKLFEAFQLRSSSLKAFAFKMLESEHQRVLTASPYMIIDSLIHMHCNRLLGRDIKKESKARLYAAHALKIIDEKMSRALLDTR